MNRLVLSFPKPSGLILLAVFLATFSFAESKAQDISCPSPCQQLDRNFYEMGIKVQELEASRDALGQQWQENQDKLDTLRGQNDALIAQMTDGLERLEPLKTTAETLMHNYQQKLPEFDRREESLEARELALDKEYDSYFSACNREVEDEQAVADCRAWYASYMSAHQKLGEDFDQFDLEVFTLKNVAESAVTTHDDLLAELIRMEARQQSILKEGAALEASSEKILQAGVDLDAQIRELDYLILLSNETPVPVKEYAAATGEAFNSGPTLVELVASMNWPLKAKATFQLGVLMANRGSYDQAITYFQRALRTVPNEPWISDTIDYIRSLQAEQVVRNSSGPIARGMIDPGTLGHMPKAAQDRVVIAMSLVDVGDFGGALELLREARAVYPADPDLRGAKVYVSQLVAQKRERETTWSDQEKARRVEIARTKGRREAAWELGMHLFDYGDNNSANLFFKEAQKDFPEDSSSYGYLDRWVTSPDDYAKAPEMPQYTSKADAILSALQYGDGSWSRSIYYLEAASNADPSNMFVRDALNYVQGMSVYGEQDGE